MYLKRGQKIKTVRGRIGEVQVVHFDNGSAKGVTVLHTDDPTYPRESVYYFSNQIEQS